MSIDHNVIFEIVLSVKKMDYKKKLRFAYDELQAASNEIEQQKKVTKFFSECSTYLCNILAVGIVLICLLCFLMWLYQTTECFTIKVISGDSTVCFQKYQKYTPFLKMWNSWSMSKLLFFILQ